MSTTRDRSVRYHVPRTGQTLLLALVIAGCAAEDDFPEEVSVEERGLLKAASIVKEVVGDDFIDQRGRRWKHVGKAEFLSPEAERVAREKLDRRPPVQAKSAREEDTMTLDELAAAMRPATVIGGHHYELAEPDYDAARSVVEYRKLEAGRVDPPPAVMKGPPPGYDVNPEELLPRVIEGSDGRVARRDNTAYPMRTQVFVTNTAMTQGCTATLVGPTTAFSAAHCFHSNSGGANGWFSRRSWSPGVDSQDANAFSYRPGTAYPAANGMLVFGCYYVWVPSQYTNGSTDRQYDFAVMDFTFCGNTKPGNAVGWIGMVKPSNGNLDGQTVYGYGYPGGSDFPCPGGSCRWPQIWGMGETGSLTYSGAAQIEYDIDTGGGQSGMAIYQLWGSDRYQVGIHQGGFTGVFDDYNFGRRITEVIYSFAETNTSWRRDSALYKHPSLGIGRD